MNTAFEPPYVQMAFGKVDLVPAQIHGLGDPQAVASHH
jgi:hypothetical protein